MVEVVMLCQKGEWGQFPKSWLYEPKLEGTRGKAEKEGDVIRIINRRGLDYSYRFPEIVDALRRIKGNFIIDGEICSADFLFSTLAQRAHLQDKFKIDILKDTAPCTYHVFDILKGNGTSFINEPLIDRKGELFRIEESERVKIVWPKPLNVLVEMVERREIEGIVAKDPNSPYEFRRSPRWIKFRQEDTEDLPIIGYEDTDKPTRPFRSLIMLRGGKEVQASSGLSGADLTMLDEAFKDKPQRVDGTKRYFLEGPIGVAEVKFYAQSPDIPYRFPRVERVRFDKNSA